MDNLSHQANINNIYVITPFTVLVKRFYLKISKGSTNHRVLGERGTGELVWPVLLALDFLPELL